MIEIARKPYSEGIRCMLTTKGFAFVTVKNVIGRRLPSAERNYIQSRLTLQPCRVAPNTVGIGHFAGLTGLWMAVENLAEERASPPRVFRLLADQKVSSLKT